MLPINGKTPPGWCASHRFCLLNTAAVGKGAGAASDPLDGSTLRGPEVWDERSRLWGWPSRWLHAPSEHLFRWRIRLLLWFHNHGQPARSIRRGEEQVLVARR